MWYVWYISFHPLTLLASYYTTFCIALMIGMRKKLKSIYDIFLTDISLASEAP